MKKSDADAAQAALAAADAARAVGGLPRAIRALHLSIDEIAAVRYLLADLRRVASSDGGDTIWCDIGAFTSNEGNPDDQIGEIETDDLLAALAELGGGVDPKSIPGSDAGHSTSAHRRRLIRATAPGRIVAARRAVDQQLGEGACKLLVAIALGCSFSVAAQAIGVSDKTVKARCVLAARALRRHYADEARRPAFARWGADNPHWRQTDDGMEIVERCATRFVSQRVRPALGWVPFLRDTASAPLNEPTGKRVASAVSRSGGNILPASIVQKIRHEIAQALIASELHRRRHEESDHAGRAGLERDLRADAVGARLPILNAETLALACARQVFVAECRRLPSPGKASRQYGSASYTGPGAPNRAPFRKGAHAYAYYGDCSRRHGMPQWRLPARAAGRMCAAVRDEQITIK